MAGRTGAEQARVLVTGAGGFVGAAVVRALLARGYVVRALVRPNRPRRTLASLPVEIVEGDLNQPACLAGILAGCRFLIHAAADYRLWVPDPEAMARTNVEATRALMRAALDAGVERVVHTSSVATLRPPADGRPADESAEAVLGDMIGPYKRTKFLAEKAVAAMVAREGLPAVIVNPSTPMGPGDARPTPTGRIVVEAAKGRIPVYVDTGLNVAHVDDVALGHVLALERGRVGERYILGGEDITLARLLGEIARLSGRRPPLGSLPRAAVMPIALAAEGWAHLTGREPFATRDGLRMARHRMFFSSAKAERELGYGHRPAAEAVAAAVKWFHDEGYLG